eukprot:TRINITY_DN1775_c0_g1_i3.p1 TRINITY_DN1775_c0_g1~~TRINITY_DN1775_c0_g1_i3.p1  ORF type:complete len:469 (+),score=111.02 TRINITY_DN1775_c0_g1_i3:126-1532(+)
MSGVNEIEQTTTTTTTATTTTTVTKEGTVKRRVMSDWAAKDSKAIGCPGLDTPTDFDPKAALADLLAGRRLPRPTKFPYNYVQQRRTMVDWLFRVAAGIQVHGRVVHLAVFYVDYLHAGAIVAESDLYVFATAALMLAAKAIENDERVPYITKMRLATAEAFTAQQLRKAELLLCERLEWRLQHPTTAEALEALLAMGVLFETDFIGDEQLTVERAASLATEMRTTLHSAAELVLLDFEFYGSSDDILASSLIAFARRSIGITPLWNEQLEKLTGTDLAAFRNCLNRLIAKFDNDFRSHVPMLPLGDSHLVPLPEVRYYAADLIIQQEELLLAQQQAQMQALAYAQAGYMVLPDGVVVAPGQPYYYYDPQTNMVYQRTYVLADPNQYALQMQQGVQGQEETYALAANNNLLNAEGLQQAKDLQASGEYCPAQAVNPTKDLAKSDCSAGVNDAENTPQTQTTEQTPIEA